MRIVLLLSSCFALGACVMAPTITPKQMADGKRGFIVNCSGSNDISACYEAASKAFNGGTYKVYADQVRFYGNTGTVNRSVHLACDPPAPPVS